MLKALIFDMDGVLVNSVKPIWESFNVVLKEEGVHFSDDYIKNNLARSLRDNLQAWKKEFGIKDYDIMEFSKKAGSIQLDLLKNEKVSQSLVNLLEQAKRQNIKCVVATSSLRWRAEKILNLLNIRTFFDVLVTADEIKNHKPAPDTFLEAARQLDVRPEECVVIEDAENGIESAKNANMKAVGLVTEYNSANELRHADIVINDFSEINIERLKKLF